MSIVARMFSISLLAIVAVSLPISAKAQAPNFQPVALTQDMAAQAIATMPDVYDVAHSYEQSVGQGDDMMSGFAGLATYAAAKADLDAAVAPYGFGQYEDWVVVIQSVMQAYAYVQSAGAMQQMAPAMDAAIQQILNNPSIPQAQKDMMIAQMGGASSAMAGMQANAPPPGNEAVVQALMPEIEEMIEYIGSVQ